MERDSGGPSVGEVTSELGGWMTAGGILSMMLFPFSVPILLLTVAALVPLLAPLLVLAVLVPPALIVRAAVRAVRRSRASRSGRRRAPASGAVGAGVHRRGWRTTP
jgi:hypothetical protein